MNLKIKMNQKEIIEKIITGIIDFKIIPFLGAGMSKPCGIPDWKEVIDELRKEFSTSTTDYLLIAQEYQDKFGREALISKLKIMCQLKAKDSVSLQNHLKILAMNPPLIYTTNYDEAIEEAAKLLLKDYKTIVELKDIVQSPHGVKQIIKFHGDFSKESSIVFTRDDYDKRLKLENYLDVLFRGHILGKSVLFLGYRFSDENIKLIFETHSALYGAENIPTSYIISFEQDEEKESELKAKNVITLVLSSADELTKLINEVNSSVYNKSVTAQFDAMRKPIPSEVLTSFELDNLKKYIASNDYASLQKQDKIRATLEVKTIPQDVEDSLTEFFENIITKDYDDKVKESILLSFQHTQFTNYEDIGKLCIKLIRLSENPRFCLNLQSSHRQTDIIDAINIIESKLGDVLQNSIESRKWSCLFILDYLKEMMIEKKKLLFNHVDRLLYGLNQYGYKEFKDLGCGFTPEHINEVIEYYLVQYESVLRARFESENILEKRSPTATEIAEQMMKGFPKDINF